MIKVGDRVEWVAGEDDDGPMCGEVKVVLGAGIANILLGKEGDAVRFTVDVRIANLKVIE